MWLMFTKGSTIFWKRSFDVPAADGGHAADAHDEHHDDHDAHADGHH